MYVQNVHLQNMKAAVFSTLYLPGYEQRGLKCALSKYRNGWKNKHIPENFTYFKTEISIVNLHFFWNTNFNTLIEDEEHLKVGLENFLEMKSNFSLNHNGFGYLLINDIHNNLGIKQTIK